MYHKYKITWLPRRKGAETLRKPHPTSTGTQSLAGTELGQDKRVVETGKPIRKVLQ